MTTFDELHWPIRTERLLLRPWRDSDLDAVWSFRRLPEVQEFLGWGAADLQAFANGITVRHGERGHHTVVIELDDMIIGDIMIMEKDGWAQAEVVDQARGVEAEVGWTLDPRHTGHGYATEAVRAAIDLCFHGLGVRRVQAGCFAANEPSWRLMERIGMRREEHSRRTALHRSGEWMDGMLYAVLADEWPSAN